MQWWSRFFNRSRDGVPISERYPDFPRQYRRKGSELQYAAAIAKHLNLELHTVDVSDQDYIDLLPETILHRGNPFIDLPSSIPFLRLSDSSEATG